MHKQSIRSEVDSQVKILTLEMMINRLRIVNYGSLVLVLSVTLFLWNTVSHDFLVAWVIVNIIITIARIQLVYKRYDQTVINNDNVNLWLTMFCLSLGITNLVWAFAFPQFISPEQPGSIVIVMFCFFTIISSGLGTLSVYLPAFLCHGIPLAGSLALYFFTHEDPNNLAFGIAVLVFYFFATQLARSGNRDMQALMRLQIEKQEVAIELEQKRKEAEQASLEKDRFLAAASHDLRQPLHSASLLLSSLQRYVKDAPAKDILNDTTSAMSALNHSFSSLLDVSKLDAGVVKPQIQHFNLADIFNSLAKEFQPSADKKGLALIFSDGGYCVHSDKNLTERIIRNLLSNAIGYTDTGTVQVVAQKEKHSIKIVVEDTGVGISEEQQALIFSEYYQVNNPERDRNQGFGLGLSIVKRLSNLLNGELHLFSNLDQGSTFTITLDEGQAHKVAAARPVESGETATRVSNFNQLKVLIVDDDKNVRNAMKIVLEGWNCITLLAESADDAIESLNKEDFIPSLILADYRLRENQTGAGAIERVRDEVNSDVPAIIITGDTSPSRIKQATDSGFQILHKPVSPAVLRSSVIKALGTNTLLSSLTT